MENDTKILLETGTRLAGPFRGPHAHNQYVLVPQGHELVGLRDRERVHHVRLGDAPSLQAYAERHKQDDATVLFYDQSGQFVLYVDYPADDVLTDHVPGHRASLDLQPTTEWQRLRAACATPISQEDFFDLLEDLEECFLTPAAAKIREVVMDFRCQKKIEFRRATNLRNGSVQLQYTDAEVQSAGEMTLPEHLMLGMSPFRGSPAFEIKVTVRYRLRDGGVRFGLAIHREDRVRELAIADVRDRFAAAHPDIAIFEGALQS